MKTILTMAVVGVATLFAAGTAKAQPILVPHTTTHLHAVPHHGHVDLMPHTTTHFHRVPAGPYGYGSYGYGSYGPRPYGGSVLVPHTTTHMDVIPHRGHVHVVPHTTTHFHRVPGRFYP